MRITTVFNKLLSLQGAFVREVRVANAERELPFVIAPTRTGAKRILPSARMTSLLPTFFPVSSASRRLPSASKVMSTTGRFTSGSHDVSALDMDEESRWTSLWM